MTHQQHNWDLAILGGGLAGLCLALQVQKQQADARIIVLESREEPPPDAAFKVGESTVEIGAWYFAQTLDLKQHLEQEQILKFGLRYFFQNSEEQAFCRRQELGASRQLHTPSYQIDRGRFERFLQQRCLDSGIRLQRGCRVESVTFGTDTHQIQSQLESVHARWVVDATGRRGLLKRQLGLEKSIDHPCGAVWFRIDEQISVQDWSHTASWLDRIPAGASRWTSTNHLMGPGYWVWLIPLASGSTSVGIVVDKTLHDPGQFKNFDAVLDWLKVHEPRCHRALMDKAAGLQDFIRLSNYAYDCSKQWDGQQRWALVGEAGRFLDPFYSPGSDFIAITNSLTCDLICRDLAKENVVLRSSLYNNLLDTLFSNWASLYQKQYPGFGQAIPMCLKTTWDFAYYWSIPAAFFCAGRISDLDAWSRNNPVLQNINMLNNTIQALFARWPGPKDAGGTFVDHSRSDLMYDWNAALSDHLDDAAFDERLKQRCASLKQLAKDIETYAASGQIPQDSMIDSIFQTLDAARCQV